MYVIDASVAVRWFLADEEHPHADAILAQFLLDPTLFAVPELFAFEVFAVLQRIHPRKEVFEEGFLPLLNTGVLRYPMTHELLSHSLVFCDAGLTGYDATYAALAEMLDGTWLTFDERAHRSIATMNRSISLAHELPKF
jgi:predicted nucleic acid-binding protein